MWENTTLETIWLIVIATKSPRLPSRNLYFVASGRNEILVERSPIETWKQEQPLHDQKDSEVLLLLLLLWQLESLGKELKCFHAKQSQTKKLSRSHYSTPISAGY